MITVLITGASSGIGEQLAYLCAEAGFRLVLSARSEDQLNRVQTTVERKYNGHATVILTDLAISEQRNELCNRLEQEGMEPDILINNAGFGLHGQFSALPLQRQLEMMEVNMSAPVHLTRRLLPNMIARDHGRILNVASAAAFAPGPNMAVYYATKAFLLRFSDALRCELKGTGISVTTLAPGPVHTNFGRVAHFEHSAHIPMQSVPVDAVARQAFNGMMRGERLVVPGISTKIATFLPRFIPTSLAAYIVRHFQSLRDKRLP